jgi:hypothetical protein
MDGPTLVTAARTKFTSLSGVPQVRRMKLVANASVVIRGPARSTISVASTATDARWARAAGRRPDPPRPRAAPLGKTPLPAPSGLSYVKPFWR